MNITFTSSHKATNQLANNKNNIDFKQIFDEMVLKDHQLLKQDVSWVNPSEIVIQGLPTPSL